MASVFPRVDRKRLVSAASKQLLGVQVPATWHCVDVAGDADFGFDVLVQVAEEGGIQHFFLLQLKGTESPSLVEGATKLSYPLKKRTLNLYASVVSDVMLAVAVVKLDDSGKLVPAESSIHWQWMSKELKDKRGGEFEIDMSDGETSVHVPVDQVLTPRLDVSEHLKSFREIIRAGLTLEDILRQAQALGQAGGQSQLSKLAELAHQKISGLVAYLQTSSDNLPSDLPPEAHAIRALIRAGNTALAEDALDKLGPNGLGPEPPQRAVVLSLRGKTFVHRRKRAEAIHLFEQAYALDSSVEHLLPLAEMRFLEALDSKASQERIAAVRDSLTNADSDDALSLRVRVHATLKEFAQAQACLDKISVPAAKLIPSLVMLTAKRNWSEAISLAVAARTVEGLSLADLTGAQVVASQAAWCGANEGVETQKGHEELPLAGAVGTNLAFAKQAWELAEAALRGLRSLAWPPNVEILAPVVCGVAGVLGFQEQAFVQLSEAAKQRPEYPDLQLHAELLAIQVGKPELALTINRRQSESIDVLVRRTSLLFELRLFAECHALALTVARSPEASNRKVPAALAMGFAAAHHLGHLVDAAELKRALDAQPEGGEHSYFAEFLKWGVLQPRSEEALSALRAGLAKYPDSWLLAANLYSNLAVNDVSAASEAVGLARLLRRRAMLTADEAARLVAAHTTLKNWPEAATEAAQALERFSSDDRLLSMGAVAEEMNGQTGAAFALLERTLQLGTSRISAIHNYMGLSFRLGRVEAVRVAIDRLLGLVEDKVERCELMRLSALVYLQQERPRDAWAAVEALGQLVDPADEEQEGTFLNVYMAVTMSGEPPRESFHAHVVQRMEAYFLAWPESKLFRRVSQPDTNERTLGLHELLDPLIGDSRARLREFERRERRAMQGEFQVPFTLRPGFVFHYIGNPFDLWDLAMRSRPEELQFHLDITTHGDGLRSPCPSRDTPLLDLTALLVLDSLNLFDKLFKVFRQIAITSGTVGFLSQHANGVLAGRRSAERARSILARINHWVNRVEQPSTVTARRNAAVLSAADIWSEYREVAKRGTRLNYCDDAICRELIRTDSPSAQFFTTVDVLELLDAAEELTPNEVACKLALLAGWNVGISVSDRFLIASLLNAWPEDQSGDASRRSDAFRDHKLFSTLSRAIWNPDKEVIDLVTHMAHLLYSMLKSPLSDVDSVAAVLANWFNRVRLLKQADGLGWKLLCYPVLLAIKSMPEAECRRLVSVLQRAVAASVAEHEMSVALEAEVTDALGETVGSISMKNTALADDLLRKLRVAMPPGTADGDRLIRSYFAEIRSS